MASADERTIEDAQSITVQEVREELNDGRSNIESSFEVSVVARTTKRVDLASEPTNFVVGELDSTKLRLDKTRSGTVLIHKKDRDPNSKFVEVIKYNHAKFQVLETGTSEISLNVSFDAVESLAEREYIMNEDLKSDQDDDSNPEPDQDEDSKPDQDEDSKLDRDEYEAPDSKTDWDEDSKMDRDEHEVHDQGTQGDKKPNPLYEKRDRVKHAMSNDPEPGVEDDKPPLRQPVRRSRAAKNEKGTVSVRVVKLEAMQEAVNELKVYLDDSIVGREIGKDEPTYDSSETSD